MLEGGWSPANESLPLGQGLSVTSPSQAFAVPRVLVAAAHANPSIMLPTSAVAAVPDAQHAGQRQGLYPPSSS